MRVLIVHLLYDSSRKELQRILLEVIFGKIGRFAEPTVKTSSNSALANNITIEKEQMRWVRTNKFSYKYQNKHDTFLVKCI